jgi:hypothetical protein
VHFQKQAGTIYMNVWESQASNSTS